MLKVFSPLGKMHKTSPPKAPMELDHALPEKKKGKGDWVPLTPAKFVPPRRGINPAAGDGVIHDVGSAENSQFHEIWRKGSEVEKESGNGDCGFGNSSSGGNHEPPMQSSLSNTVNLGTEKSAEGCSDQFPRNSGSTISGITGSNGESDGMGDGISGKRTHNETDEAGESFPGIKRSQSYNHDFGPGSVKNTNTPNNSIPKKRRNSDVDSNKKPGKRQKMIRHRPKVFDETKPQKVRKSQGLKPSTPKLKTPNRAVRRTSPLEERKKSNLKASVDPSKDAGEEAVSGSLLNAKGSCRRKLDFDLNVVTQVQIKDDFQVSTNSSDFHGQTVYSNSGDGSGTFNNSLNGNLESQARDAFQEKGSDKIIKQAENIDLQQGKESPSNAQNLALANFFGNLDSNLKLEPQDLDSCPGIKQIVENYHRLQKGSKKLVNKGEKNVDSETQDSKVYYDVKDKPEADSVFHSGCRFSPLLVNECFKNSRKLGPVFPAMFKKTRMQRQRTTVFDKFFHIIKVPNKRLRKVVPEKVLLTWNKGRMKAKKKKNISGNIGCRIKKRVVKHSSKQPAQNTRQRMVSVILPTEKQRKAAIEDPKSFECVLNLCPMVRNKKRRSQVLERRLKSLIARVSMEEQNREEAKHKKVSAVKYKNSKASTDNSSSTESMINFAIQKLEGFRIDDGYDQLVVWDQKAQGAIVPSSKGKSNSSTRNKPLSKVHLDSETTRMWNLLMENKGGEDTEELDEDRAKYREEQRKIFRGRVESFIARMHLIQGDRRFSPWKGSVVDSVVGVFLTQNVSDHLSSSAYMSLAARFPPKPVNENNGCEGNVVSSQESVVLQNSLGNDDDVVDEMDKSRVQELEIDVLTSGKCQESVCLQDSSVNDGAVDEMDKLRVQELEIDELTSGKYQESVCLEEDSSGNDCAVHETDKSRIQEVGIDERTIDNCQESVMVEKTPSTSHNVGVESSSGNKTSSHSESIPGKKKRKVKDKQEVIKDWDNLRKTHSKGKSRRPVNSVDWKAVYEAEERVLSLTIRKRGMNNILAGKLKDLLVRVNRDHGSIDLEWLRDVPEDEVKDYLLSINGLGLKSVECVRLLALHHHAFPVDVNVGRILVRLGWVPLQPLPGNVQIHLLNTYPVVDTVQKYVWPRLCTLDQPILYEFHYQLITFGKVFCTKRAPNCNACPMRGECRHFASAFASAKLRLQGSETENTATDSSLASQPDPPMIHRSAPLISHSEGDFSEGRHKSSSNCEPIIEIPPSPEPVPAETLERDIEDFGYDSEDEIPTIRLNSEEFKENVMNFMDKTKFLCGEDAMSKALVSLSPEAASIPMRKLKAVSRLRTEHQVYELPDSHPLLSKLEKREPDDPSPYLLAIWITDETTNSSQDLRKACNCQDSKPCEVGACCSEDILDSQNDLIVKGTILIPCRTAMRGSFPLNGTYFQVNEVFADHESSQKPIAVPRKWLWNLRRRPLYCGTSVTSIFRGFSMKDTQYAFWRGFICVRGFERESRAPKPLARRFHVCRTRPIDDDE